MGRCVVGTRAVARVSRFLVRIPRLGKSALPSLQGRRISARLVWKE